MIKVFDTLNEYNTYTINGTTLKAGDLYYVLEDKSTHFRTNNIDGTLTKYDLVDESEFKTLVEGTLTANGTYEPENADGYSKVTVNVPQPTGNIELTENGENINIAQYATATVNVAGSGGIEFNWQNATYNNSARHYLSIMIAEGKTYAIKPSQSGWLNIFQFITTYSLWSVNFPYYGGQVDPSLGIYLEANQIYLYTVPKFYNNSTTPEAVGTMAAFNVNSDKSANGTDIEFQVAEITIE